MTFSIGTRLGFFEIASLIGSGGMGEVYRARDSKLNRDVALKVLPDLFANDPERLARFQREAQVLASLNHPNIGGIYGLEEANGVQALVLELVEGPTLADRIAQGPIPLEEALPIARQIADALEAAHEHGIIHRDLKPANIKIRPDGTVKVLDFGLAKLAQASDSGLQASGLSQSPTITTPAATRMGVIMGTAAYMSPEQAKGKPLDKRTDIWAFGCVLYEMLTGKRAFEGDDVSDTLAAILRAEPQWSALPAHTPSNLRRLLQRCLQKDPRLRIRDIGDARIEIIEIDDALAAPADAVPIGAPVPGARRHDRLPWTLVGITTVVAVLATSGLAILYLRRPTAEPRPITFSVAPPENTLFSTGNTGVVPNFLTVSPDGTRLAFLVRDSSGIVRLWDRPLDSLSAQPLAGTEGAGQPFWSPDSRFLAFVAGGKLKKVAVTGGPLQTLCDAPGTSGGTWNRDGLILFTAGTGQIHQVSAGGGKPTLVSMLDKSRQENAHLWPHFLPDGKRFLYFARSTNSEQSGIYVKALDADEVRLVARVSSNVAYVSPGHLVFASNGTLMAQPFDAAGAETTGDPFPIAERLNQDPTTGRAAFAVSETGMLTYQSGVAEIASRLIWFDRSGKQAGVLGEPGDYVDLQLSPDKGRAAVSLLDPTLRTRDIWLYDIARGIPIKLTTDPSHDQSPIWSPDATRILFGSNRNGRFDLYQKASSGTGGEELVPTNGIYAHPRSWSSDGRFVLYVIAGNPRTGQDLWVLPLSGDRKPFPFLQTRFEEGNGQFSADGRWIAYFSNESGRNEVYVTRFPGFEGKVRVSTAGGTHPRWRSDGKELFYLASDNNLMAAEVNGQGSGFDVGAVQPLFETRPKAGGYPYDVSRDGQRFLVNTLVEQAQAPVTVVVNWPALLKR